MQIITKTVLCSHSSSSSLQDCIDEISGSAAKCVMILASESDGWTAEQVDSVLENCRLPLFGGVFPFILQAGQKLSSGTLLVGLSIVPDIFLVENLSVSQHEVNRKIGELETRIRSAKSLITLVDGLSENIERLTEGLYAHVSQHANTLGCGAGSLDFIQRPCIFTNQGLIQDAAVIAAFPESMGLGLAHGWEILDGPFQVTASKGNVLETLNYVPAFDVYRKYVEKGSDRKLSKAAFFDLAKTFPLGIENLEGDILVRDPIQLDGSKLVCVGELPVNALVYLLHGEAEKLVSAAGHAADQAQDSSVDSCSKENPGSAVIFDCISRALFLDDGFQKELNSIEAQLGEHCVSFGALTLGEIGNSSNGPIEWLNKSTVIGVF